ncbi:MAG: hypothetical protein HYR72_25245 [Deltaproteobacteria bacterium]|nr:hypothetical protein [Deltaproteobacteria bacterium]MBI3388483.1 hypothetical protein [Deltaproteobacteria bacterium]
MSQRIVARAPGKLVLLGEYAVLDGCPAIVSAVNRYAEVRVSRSPSARVRIAAADLGLTLDFPEAQSPPIRGPLRFVLAAYGAAARAVPQLSRTGLAIDVISSQASHAGTKIGLGSSAAITAATVGALLAIVDRDPDPAEVFALAWRAHRAAQAGMGSGADVAASCYGGTLHVQPQGDQVPLVRRLKLPDAAMLLAGWTGESAATTDLIQRYLTARNGHAAHRSAFVQESQACVELFRDSLALGLLSLVALNCAGESLDRLGGELGLPILTPALRQLVTIARNEGAAAKVSGAGGGDCGIAFTQSRDTAARIRAAWQAAGITPLALDLDQEGVRVARL